MSKESCDSVASLLAQAIVILKSGACGEGKSVAMTITHSEDAILRIHHHMREHGWVIGSGAAPRTVHDAATTEAAKQMAVQKQPLKTIMPFNGKDTGTMQLVGMKPGMAVARGPQRPPENQAQLLGLFS